MTTYNSAAVSDTAIAFKKPITLQQGRALRDNPIAITEAATDAVYVQQEWHPYNGVTVGDGNDGVFYDFAVHGALTAITTPDFADGYEYLIIINELASGAAPNLTIALYGATTADFGSEITLVSAAALAECTGEIRIVRPRRSLNKCVIDGYVQNAAAAGVTTPIEYAERRATAQKRLRARLTLSTSSLSGGKVYLYRRRDYMS